MKKAPDMGENSSLDEEIMVSLALLRLSRKHASPDHHTHLDAAPLRFCFACMMTMA
jgi:hypothetical protein